MKTISARKLRLDFLQDCQVLKEIKEYNPNWWLQFNQDNHLETYEELQAWYSFLKSHKYVKIKK